VQDKKIKFNKMKKIFTLGLGLMFTMAVFAADRKPTVTVTASKKYEIVIDGRHYMSNGSTISISSLFNGRHDVKVYEARQGFFMKSKRLIASSAFQLKNSDVQINIDRSGQLQITESRSGRDWNDRDNGRDKGRDNDRNQGHDRDNHDRRF
jgi:hypothetical protein